MISTFLSARRCFSPRAWAVAGSIVLLASGRHALAQSAAQSGGFLEHEAVTPPLLFREVWQQPAHSGPLNDENRRITPQALTNPDLEMVSIAGAGHMIPWDNGPDFLKATRGFLARVRA